MADVPLQARRASPVEQFWRWSRRNPVTSGLLCCIAVLLAVVFLGTVVYAHRLQAEFQKTEAANTKANDALYHSHLRHAQAARWSGRPGQHFESLAAIGKANELLVKQNWDANRVARQQQLLRDEAIAASTLFDLKLPESQDHRLDQSCVTAVNLEHLALGDASGRVSVLGHGSSDEKYSFLGASAPTARLLWSARGSYLAALFQDKLSGSPKFQIRIWEMNSGEDSFGYESIQGPIRLSGLAFSEDERAFAYFSGKNQVRVIGLPDGNPLGESSFASQPVQLRFSGDERTAWVCLRSGELKSWNYRANKVVDVACEFQIASIDWNANSNLLSAGCASGEVLFKRLGRGNQDWNVLVGHADYVGSIRSSQDGGLLASRSWDGTTRFWDTRTKSVVLRLDQNVGVEFLGDQGDAHAPDAIALTPPKQSARIVQRSSTPRLTLQSHVDPVYRWSIAFHPTLDDVLVSANESETEIWNLRRKSVTHRLATGKAMSAHVSGNGRWLSVATSSGVRNWSLDWHRQDGHVHLNASETAPGDQQAGKSSWTKDGHQRVLVRQHDVVVVGQSKVGSVELRGHPGGGNAVIGPAGNFVVTSRWGAPGITAWDAQTGLPIRNLQPSSFSGAAAFSGDGRWLATADKSALTLWSVGDWKEIRKRSSTNDWPGSLCFSPDGSILASSTERFSVQLIDTATFEVLATLPSSGRFTARSIAFHPSGTKLAIGEDKNLCIWDLVKLREMLGELRLNW